MQVAEHSEEVTDFDYPADPRDDELPAGYRRRYRELASEDSTGSVKSSSARISCKDMSCAGRATHVLVTVAIIQVAIVIAVVGSDILIVFRVIGGCLACPLFIVYPGAYCLRCSLQVPSIVKWNHWKLEHLFEHLLSLFVSVGFWPLSL